MYTVIQIQIIKDQILKNNNEDNNIEILQLNIATFKPMTSFIQIPIDGHQKSKIKNKKDFETIVFLSSLKEQSIEST